MIRKPLFFVITAILIIAISIAGYLTWKSFSPSPSVALDEVKLINPLGPLVVPVAAIDSGQLGGELNLKVDYWKSTDEAIALLAADKTDFAILPITTASNIFANDIDIALLGVHEWKVFYLLAPENSQFDGWQSLRGKTIYTPVGKGQTVDVLIRYALSSEGIDPDKDVIINYAPPQEIVSLFSAGKMDFAALPEPFVSLGIQKGKGKIVLDFQEYWGEISGMPARLPIAGLFVTHDFLEKHPRESKEVATMLAESTNWANNNVDEALNLSSEILPIPQAVMKNALNRIEFNYIPTKDCQDEVENFLSQMHKLYPEAIPQLPDKGFYAK